LREVHWQCQGTRRAHAPCRGFEACARLGVIERHAGARRESEVGRLRPAHGENATKNSPYCYGGRKPRKPHSEEENGMNYSGRCQPLIRLHRQEREKLEVVFLVKPSALESLHRKASAGGERQGIHHQLIRRIDLPGVRFVIEKMDETISRLHYIDVASD